MVLPASKIGEIYIDVNSGVGGDDLVEVGVVEHLAQLRVGVVQSVLGVEARRTGVAFGLTDVRGRDVLHAEVPVDVAHVSYLAALALVGELLDAGVVLAQGVEVQGVGGDELVGRVVGGLVFRDVGADGGAGVGLGSVDGALGRAHVAALAIFLSKIEGHLPRVGAASVLLDDAGPSYFQGFLFHRLPSSSGRGISGRPF